MIYVTIYLEIILMSSCILIKLIMQLMQWNRLIIYIYIYIYIYKQLIFLMLVSFFPNVLVYNYSVIV